MNASRSSFAEALDREESELPRELELLRATSGYRDTPFRTSYAARGMYAEQLERWLELFPREQLLVLTTDELAAQPEEAMERIADFLGVPPWRAGEYRLRGVQGEEPLAPELRERLARNFAEPNARLEKLLERTLDWIRALKQPQGAVRSSACP